MIKVSKHKIFDWCHICGKRKDNLADIWYSANAENWKTDKSQYVRICGDCADTISNIANEPTSGSMESV